MRNKKGQFAVGNSGRKEGSKNVKKKEDKDRLETMFNEHGGFQKVFELISSIECPKDQATLLLKVVEYFKPKLKSIDMNTTIDDNREDRSLEDIQKELDQINQIDTESWTNTDDD